MKDYSRCDPGGLPYPPQWDEYDHCSICGQEDYAWDFEYDDDGIPICWECKKEIEDEE